MRVLHIIPSLSATQGGPSAALPLMIKGLVTAGIELDVATTDDDGYGRRLEVSHGPVVRDATRYFYFPKQTDFYKVSFPMARWLFENADNYELLHIHALFSFSSIAGCVAGLVRRVPYVIRPLGVLNHWGLSNRRPLLKKMSLRFIELPLVTRARAIHFTSDAERAEVLEIDRDLDRVPSYVIPLPIPEADGRDSSEFLAAFPAAGSRKLVLFLSRLDRKKGLELLIEAFATVRRCFPDVSLVVAGDGEVAYRQELLRLVAAAGIGESVIWTGQLGGEVKRAAFAAAACFVLPSSSENFGIAAAEALAAGLPIVVSKEVALSGDVVAYDAGLVVARTPEKIAEAICALLQDKQRASQMKINAKQLVAERYSPRFVAERLAEMYRDCMR